MEYLIGENNRRFKTESTSLEEVIEDIRALYPKCIDIKLKRVSMYYYDIYLENMYKVLLIDTHRHLYNITLD